VPPSPRSLLRRRPSYRRVETVAAALAAAEPMQPARDYYVGLGLRAGRPAKLRGEAGPDGHCNECRRRTADDDRQVEVLRDLVTSWSNMFEHHLATSTTLNNWYRYNVCRTHLGSLLDELKRDDGGFVCRNCCNDCLERARKRASLQAERNFKLGSDIARFLGVAAFSDADAEDGSVSSEDGTASTLTAEFISESIRAHENPAAGTSNDEAAMCLAHRWESLMGQQRGPPPPEAPPSRLGGAS
jgi:hypothetical protein